MSQYIYQGLDDILSALNPTTIQPIPMSPQSVSNIEKTIKQEKQQVQVQLQNEYFSINEGESTAQLIIKSHNALVVLINRTYEFKQHELAVATNLLEPLDFLLNTLEQLLYWFHSHYDAYLTAEQLYPITKLVALRDQICEEKEYIKDILNTAGNTEKVIGVVINALEGFAEKIELGKDISKHEARYHKDLLRDIKKNDWNSHVITDCPTLHEMLVYWNLNSKECISYFSTGFEEVIKAIPDKQQRINYWREQIKYAKQLPELPNSAYNPKYPSLKKYFLDYFQSEIEYLEGETSRILTETNGHSSDEETALLKVLSTLSVDQIALILRAGKDTKALLAKSFDALYEALAPFIASIERADISWKSMRSKAFSGEERDKAIVISLLKEMISTIERY
jgi:hypothetical protein